ncbi:dienelactone hydrolase family protein [Streptomyces sp. NPDC048489]|uniref:dienelactone hydrolase family protein n=1 Tax=Streptomyces sp. NPDC048489 TaxID=3154504 RepID=UPI00343437D7
MCHVHSTAPLPPSPVRRDERRTSGADPVPYLVFEPDTDRPGEGAEPPRIVIASDIFGVNPFYRYLAGLLAEQGYRVIVPDLFHRVGEARDAGRDAAFERRALLDDVRAVGDLGRVIDEIGGASGRFGMLGFCLGGTFALLTAAGRPNQATVTYYAFPKGVAGARIPTDEPIEVAARTAGPVLAFWGRQDYIDPGEVDLLDAALERAPGEHEVVWYERAGHSFLAGLSHQEHDSADAAADSWQRTLGFFGKHLGASVTAA